MHATTADRTAATFANHPEATLVVEEFGHAYGKANFNSTCPLTGDTIVRGEAIRKVALRTRDGHHFEGYIANRTIGLMQFAGGYDGDAMYTCWTRFTADKVIEAIEAAEPGTRITVAYHNGGFGDNETRSWSLSQEPAFAGKWLKGYAKSSPKQLIAAMRRAKNALVFKVEPPRK